MSEVYEDIGEDELFLLEDAELASNVSDGQLNSVQELGNRQLKLEQLIDRLEEAVKDAKEAKRKIAEDLLPKKLMEVGLSSFTLQTGESISMEHLVAATMPKADTPEFPKAISWLEDQGIGDIVKKVVEAKFGRGDQELADRVMAAIMQVTNGNIPVEMKESVNYMTMNSVFKQRMQKGESLPTAEDGFSIYIGPRTKIKRPKAEKSKK